MRITARKLGFGLLILSVFAFFPGCVILPVPGDGSPPNVSDEVLATIQPSVSSRDEVLALLREPTAIWEDCRVYIYNEGASSRMLVLGIEPNDVVDGGGDDLILIRFDDNWRVASVDRLIAPITLNRFGEFLRDWVHETEEQPDSNPCPNEASLVAAAQDLENSQKLLLLRFVPIADDTAIPAFPRGLFAGDDWVGIGTGNFSTGGRIEPLNPRRLEFLSDESRSMGWTYLTVNPGVNYLTFHPANRADVNIYRNQIENSPPYRVAIPADGPSVIYGGTIELQGDAGPCLFGGNCKYIDRLRGVAIVDESSDATAISSAHLFEDGPVSTALLERHEGPLVLTTN